MSLKDMYGKSKTIIPSFSITVFIIYYTFIILFNKNLTLQNISHYYNSDISNVAGVLAGFVFASFGLLIGLDNNIIKNLKTTKNINAVNKVLLYTVFFFVITIIIYFLKDLIIYDYNAIANFSSFRYLLIKHILLFGLYCFANAFVLFLLSLYILKKIIIT